MAVNIKIKLLGCDTIQSGVNNQRNIINRLHGVIPEHCSITSRIYITTIASLSHPFMLSENPFMLSEN